MSSNSSAPKSAVAVTIQENKDDDGGQTIVKKIVLADTAPLVFFGSAIIRNSFDSILLEHDKAGHWCVVAMYNSAEKVYELFTNKQKKNCLDFIRLANALVRALKKGDAAEIDSAEKALHDLCMLCTANEVKDVEHK